MPNEITIENLKLSDKDQAIAFLQRAYDDNPRMSDENFWDWHYTQAPYKDAEKLPVWIAKSGDKIAGQVAAIPFILNVGGEPKNALWMVDLVVLPEFRRHGLAKRLVGAMEEFCPLVLAIGTNEQHTPRLLQGLGFVLTGKIPRFHKFLFAGNDIREISNLNPLREAVNLVSAIFRPRFKENKNVRIVEKFDASFDSFWAESEMQWACAARRDAKMLEWQYLRQPEKKFDIIGYYEGEKLLGYAVLFFRKKNARGLITKAAISDICYHPRKPKETIDALLQKSLEIAIERRAGGLVTDINDDLLAERLARFGFWRVKNPLQPMLKSPDRQDLVYNAKNWFLTRGDSDISIFEEPNL